jgi:hypothetical protein
MVIASNVTHSSVSPGPDELEKQMLAHKNVDGFHLCAQSEAGRYSVLAFCRNNVGGSSDF